MLGRLLGYASALLAWIGGIALVMMMLHIAADVVARYVFNAPLHGTVEIVSSYYMVAVVFLPLAMIERANGHIVVELATRHLPGSVQNVLIGVVALLSAAYFGAFAWQTGGDAIKKYEIGEQALGTVAVTVWPTRFFLPVGCGMIALVLVYKAIRLFRGERKVLQPHVAREAIE
ncbi:MULTISPECIES: TRAP transporter small permease [Rhodopseudomonas]|uniref:TRAP transporter small permease protein n=1 Tax=Rhodopseudomonas palustris (strain DX-1) TaxID=652103 RepID=E6VNX0_RHOPX|nr:MULTISPECIES: TRAP transporter small permease [Rhodopseudomonas]NEW88359.1 TRAP transporter small permease [Rhodopseudomonas sp. WA056]QDL98758.1 TRAP transporter small permease [Rhodopseudomonas palustris]